MDNTNINTHLVADEMVTMMPVTPLRARLDVLRPLLTLRRVRGEDVRPGQIVLDVCGGARDWIDIDKARRVVANNPIRGGRGSLKLRTTGWPHRDYECSDSFMVLDHKHSGLCSTSSGCASGVFIMDGVQTRYCSGGTVCSAGLER